MQETNLKNMKKLGDLVVTVASKDLNKYPYYCIFSQNIASDTDEELMAFFNQILKEITGEPELTWSLPDAVNIMHATGDSVRPLSKGRHRGQGPTHIWGELNEIRIAYQIPTRREKILKLRDKIFFIQKNQE